MVGRSGRSSPCARATDLDLKQAYIATTRHGRQTERCSHSIHRTIRYANRARLHHYLDLDEKKSR